MGLIKKARAIKAGATTREGRLGIAAGAVTAVVGHAVPGLGLAAPVVANKVAGWAKDNSDTIDAVENKIGEGVSAVKGRLSHFMEGRGEQQPADSENPSNG